MRRGARPSAVFPGPICNPIDCGVSFTRIRDRSPGGCAWSSGRGSQSRRHTPLPRRSPRSSSPAGPSRRRLSRPQWSQHRQRYPARDRPRLFHRLPDRERRHRRDRPGLHQRLSPLLHAHHRDRHARQWLADAAHAFPLFPEGGAHPHHASPSARASTPRRTSSAATRPRRPALCRLGCTAARRCSRTAATSSTRSSCRSASSGRPRWASRCRNYLARDHRLEQGARLGPPGWQRAWRRPHLRPDLAEHLRGDPLRPRLRRFALCGRQPRQRADPAVVGATVRLRLRPARRFRAAAHPSEHSGLGLLHPVERLRLVPLRLRRGPGGRPQHLLDGNTWEDSPRVDKEILVGDLQCGLAVPVGDVRIAYAQVVRTPEFQEKDSRGLVPSVSSPCRRGPRPRRR